MVRHLRVLVFGLAWFIGAPAFADDTGHAVDAERHAITFLQAHSFSRSEARIRIQQLLDYWARRYGLKQMWSGDVAKFEGEVMGVPFAGEVVVGDHDVSAVTSDPGVLFRSAASAYVQQKLRKYLHPTYSEG